MSENSCLCCSEHFPYGSVAMYNAQDLRQLNYYSLESVWGSVILQQLIALKVAPGNTANSQVMQLLS